MQLKVGSSIVDTRYRGMRLRRSRELPLDNVIRIGVLLSALAALVACTEACPTTRIGRAAIDVDSILTGGSSDQLDRWAPSLRVDALLRETIRDGGVAALGKVHGLQCVPRLAPDDCPDCYVCNATFPAESYAPAGYFAALVCRADGTMSVRAEVGPANAVRSMTYWHPERSPR